MKYWSAALAAVGLLVVPALASAATSQKREQVSVAVQSSDLDLGRPENVAKLRDRVSRAIAQTCNPGDRLNADLRPDWQCRREMGANAEIAMNHLLSTPQSRVASN
jgi:UrcA family protein